MRYGVNSVNLLRNRITGRNTVEIQLYMEKEKQMVSTENSLRNSKLFTELKYLLQKRNYSHQKMTLKTINSAKHSHIVDNFFLWQLSLFSRNIR